jgi:hypothetical protein
MATNPTIEGGLAGVAAKVANMGPLMMAMSASLGKMAETFDAYQKPLLALGTSINLVPTSISNAAKDLPVGLSDALGTITKSFQAGLFDVGKNTLTLAARMDVNGEESKVLFQGLRNFTASMGTYTGGTEGLSKTLLESSDRYHISTTSLIKSLDALGSTFEKIRPLADPKVIADLAIGLTGEVGAGKEDLVNRFLKAFLDPSVASQVQSSLLGIDDLRQKALTGNLGKEELLLRIPPAIEKMNSLVGDSILMQGEIPKIFGDMGISLGSINATLNSLDDETKRSIAINTNFSASWGTFTKEVMRPIQESLMTITSYVLSFATKIGSMWSGIIAGLVPVLGFVLQNTLKGAIMAPLLTVFGPWTALIGGIFAAVIAISNMLSWGDSEEKKAADEAALSNKDKVIKEYSKFSETLRSELGAVMSFIQLNGPAQMELLSAIAGHSETTAGNTKPKPESFKRRSDIEANND